MSKETLMQRVSKIASKTIAVRMHGIKTISTA